MTEKSSPSKAPDDGEFRKWLWDPDRKAFMGRTGTNWIQLLVFYTLFYLCLAAFWCLALLLFMQTIDYKYPKWQQDESRIGVYPGLGFRPRPSMSKVETTLIWFTSGSNGNFKQYTDDLEDFLKPYVQDAGDDRGGNVATVDDCKNPQFVAPAGKYCPFNYKEVFTKPDEPCNVQNKFGYDKGAPCVLVKINKIYGWVPKPYAETAFPSKMPAADKKGGGVVITCEGENPADKENIGEIVYRPSGSIPTNHFPFTNQEGYLAPFIMVQFKNPTRGILINVECKAWAENIRYNRKEGEGSVHFELLVD